MKMPDYYFHVADPELAGQPGVPNLVLRFQTVESKDNRPQRSGKYIHLELTTAFAMQLLGHLTEAKRRLGLPDPLESTVIAVPPAKDRN